MTFKKYFFDCEKSDATRQNVARSIVGFGWAILPPLAIFATGAKHRPTSDAAKVVKWRPSPPIYITAWSILSVLLSLSWIGANARSKSDDCIGPVEFVILSIAYALVIITCIVWQIVYNDTNEPNEIKRKQNAIGVMVLLIMLSLMLIGIVYKRQPHAASALLPLLIWGVFQLGVSGTELQNL